MVSDFKYIVLWWLTVSALGLVTLPTITYIFRNFWDKGYVFSKVISLSIISFLVFVLGVFKLVPFTPSAIFFIALFVFGLQYFVLKKIKYWPEFISTLRQKFPIFIAQELIFLIILTSWSFVRGFAPSIEGLEKFMDWGFVNSILRTTYMPPKDMWFSGSPINYYYFGHIMFALLTKLSGISSTITYNLSIALVCALTFVSTFSLSSNLAYLLVKNNQKKVSLLTCLSAGLFSALLLTFGGNLHSLYKISSINIKDNGHLVLTLPAYQKAAESYWYPDATRFIGFDPDVKDKTIHEFPLYSFVVADLHGHMNDIVVVLCIIAFLLAQTVTLFPSWLVIIPLSFMLSIAYMTNAWDFAVYGLVFATTSFLTNKSILKSITNGILVIICWYLFSLPYNINFTPMAQGLKLSDMHSPFYQLFVLYGGFWLIVTPFVLLIIKKLKAKSTINQIDLFVLGLILTATILIIIPEIGYIKDIYIYEHRRANTMFKLVYEAFMLYAVVAGYVLVKLRHFFPYKILFALIFVIQLMYPYFAIRSYYGNLKTYQGLYGFKYLKDRFPDNYAAIEWIQNNIIGQPVMLEAVGDSYTDFNQVSMSTGLPTVEGWIVHEWLWRGGYDQPAARQADVLKIYTSKDKEEVRSLLQKYSVDYIFVGDKEFEKYPEIKVKNFSDLGATIVFESGKTKIYKLIK